jgi:hypothetical protein
LVNQIDDRLRAQRDSSTLRDQEHACRPAIGTGRLATELLDFPPSDFDRLSKQPRIAVRAFKGTQRSINPPPSATKRPAPPRDRELRSYAFF